MNIPRVELKPIRRKKGTSYQIDYRLNGKRIRYIAAHNKKDAQIILAEKQHELTYGIHGIRPFNSKIISLKELLSSFLLSKNGTVRDSTYKRYVNYFTVFERFMYKYFTDACEDINQIKPIYLHQCFLRLSKENTTKNKPWHPTTINTLRELLSEVFKKAIKEKYITENPITDTRPLDAPKIDRLRFYSKDQLKSIFENLDPKWVPMIKFWFFTGLRKGELINLTWDKVSLDKDNPWVRVTNTQTHRTKTGKTQTIRITSQALEILKGQAGKSPKHVFPSEKGNTIRPATPNEALNKALNKAGLEGTIHMLRHTFASHFLMDRVGSLNDLTNYLSHADSETTKIYAHLSPEYQAEIVKNLEKSQEFIVQKE